MKRMWCVLPVLAGFVMGLVAAGTLQSAEAQRATAAPEACSVTLARRSRQLRAARLAQEEAERELAARTADIERLLARERIRVMEIERRIGTATKSGNSEK